MARTAAIRSTLHRRSPHSSARLGSDRLGSARLGSARLGSARLGSARLGSARTGSARPGVVWRGVVLFHSARCGRVARCGAGHSGHRQHPADQPVRASSSSRQGHRVTHGWAAPTTPTRPATARPPDPARRGPLSVYYSTGHRSILRPSKHISALVAAVAIAAATAAATQADFLPPDQACSASAVSSCSPPPLPQRGRTHVSHDTTHTIMPGDITLVSLTDWQISRICPRRRREAAVRAA